MVNNVVRVWEETVMIPTYGIGEPEKNPIFLEKRVYQGSSGVVYPHPVIETISDEKTDQPWRACYLENEWIKVMILPELGGRVQMAFDKIKQRHFIYYNSVIKPALVGLTGPWISGGIEFNWPQHHRPSTYDPVDYSLEQHPDGSATVWCSEVEIMFRTKGTIGFRLYPDRAVLELNVRLYNRTHLPQTFLWWANPAVHVNDHYQSIFPPDVYAVFDHGRRDVSSFPIARGTYYKVNYAPGTDISRYKNIPVPTSYMAVESNYNFIGGYEHDTKGGMLHVANRHISPGKKQWTWGNGDFGQAWDRNLTDSDGPYIELMCGVYTDNQPDFSWIMPHEERVFQQWYYPYADLSSVKNATADAAVNLEIGDGTVELGFYTTAVQTGAVVELHDGGRLVFSEKIDLAPNTPALRSVPHVAGNPAHLRVRLLAAGGAELVAYQPEQPVEKEIPPPAKAALPPADVASNEQLYLTGLHLEQYRHATFSPLDYWQEALRRDPADSRCNNAMGLWLLRRGQFAAAEPYFRTAVNTLIARNPNPYDGEPLYNLGLTLKFLGRFEEAFAAFFKATWNAAWQDVAYLELARLAARRASWHEALELVDKALDRNRNSQTARHLRTLVLRKIDATAALQAAEDTLALDPFHFGCWFEKALLTGDDATFGHLQHLIRRNQHTAIEYALDYAHAGQFADAALLLERSGVTDSRDPRVHYLLGWLATQTGQHTEAQAHFQRAAACPPERVFPNRLEEVLILQTAIEANPADAHAPYYLGNFWYAHRQYDAAMACWEAAAQLAPTFPTPLRNLALAFFNKKQDPQRALALLEQAFQLDTTDARILMELDQLYKRLNHPPAARLALLEKHPAQTAHRDDLWLERLTLLNQLGQHAAAKALLDARQFHPWEGGEGKTVAQHLLCCTELAKTTFRNGDYPAALHWLSQATTYPHNLGEGKLYGARENDVHYLAGLCQRALGNLDAARAFFEKATVGDSTPTQAFFYNDQQPDKIFYQGLAWRALGHEDQARAIFQRLSDFGQAHLHDHIQLDYFAVSLPDLAVFDADLDVRNRLHCHYLLGLGALGLGDTQTGIRHLQEVLSLDVNHQAAAVHLRMATEANGVFF